MHAPKALIFAVAALLAACTGAPSIRMVEPVAMENSSEEVTPSPTQLAPPTFLPALTPAPEPTPIPTTSVTPTPLSGQMAQLVYTTVGGTWWTFDDCERPYLPGTVAAIVAVLQKSGIEKATFFMNGDCYERRPDLVSTIREAGFEIGNHAHDHVALSRLPSVDAVLDQIKRGPPGAKVFRSPNWDVGPMVRRAASLAGYSSIIMASVNTGDSSEANTCPTILRNIGRPGPTSIVAMHMTNRDTPKALEAYFGGRGC